MSSFRVSLWMLTACGLLSGCVMTPDGKVALKMFYKEPVSAEKLADKEESKEKTVEKKAEKPAAVASTEKSDNPFRKKESDAGKAPEADRTAAKPSEETKVVAAKAETSQPAPPQETAKQTTKGSGVLNAETLKLIDEELADATPEERADWYEQLKRVDPAVIPQILQARKMSLQVAGMRQPETASDSEYNEFEKYADAGSYDRDGKRNRTAKRSARSDRRSEIEPVGHQAAEGNAASTDTQDAQPSLAEGAPSRSRWLTPGKQSPFGRGENNNYAVQRASNESSASETAPGAAAASPATAPRQGLARFLPRGVPGSTAQLSANSPSSVSLMPPHDSSGTSDRGGLDQLISDIEADVANWQPGTTEEEQTLYIQRHVYLRLLYLMADHPERALTAIPGVDPADQEFWQQMLWAMTNYFDTQHIPAAKDRASQAVAQLETASLRLREHATLELRNMAFCRQINYFGNFERFPRDEFHPGQEALLYAEIENFKSELTVDGQYRTLLKSTIEIVSPSGEVRWQKDFPATEDLCNSHRQDYFHNYQFSIPERLPLGPHKLKLTVIDELSGKIASQSINFMAR